MITPAQAAAPFQPHEKEIRQELRRIEDFLREHRVHVGPVTVPRTALLPLSATEIVIAEMQAAGWFCEASGASKHACWRIAPMAPEALPACAEEPLPPIPTLLPVLPPSTTKAPIEKPSRLQQMTDVIRAINANLYGNRR